MKKILYLPVEVKSRELRAKVLLATEMADRGFKVLLGTHWVIREAAKYEPGIILDKDGCLGRKEIFEQICNRGGAVYVQDEEMLSPTIEKELLKYRVSDDMAQRIKGYFLSSDYYSDLFKDRFPAVYSKSYVVGNARIDLSGTNIKYYYKKELIKIRKKYGKYILVNSGFTKVNETLFHIIESHARIKLSDKDKLWYYRYGEYCDENREMFIDSIAAIADKYDDITVVVRPHPAEDMDLWLSKLKHKKHVIVSKKGDANAWNYGAEFIIHSGCTTALEAYLIRKKSIMYQPKYNQSFEYPFFEQLSERVTSKQELFQVIDKYLSPDYSNKIFFTKEKRKLLKYYLHNPEGGMAVQRIADILEDHDFERSERIHIYSPTIKTRYAILKNLCASFLSKDPVKFSYTSPNELRRMIQASKKVLGIEKDIPVKRLSNNIFRIG